jgi:hypothetical protein
MRRLALILLSVACGSASAQTISEFSLNNLTLLRFNRAACEGPDLELRVGFAGVSGQYRLRYLEMDRVFPCTTDLNDLINANPPNAVIVLGDRENTRDTFVPIPGPAAIELLPVADLLRDDSCAGEGRRVELYLCAQLFGVNELNTGFDAATIVMDIDTTVPPVPAVKNVLGGNKQVTISFDDIPASDDGDVYRFRVDYRLCPLASDEIAEVDPDSSCGADASAEIESEIDENDVNVPAENGRVIEFRAVTLDDFDNESEATAWQQAESSPDLSVLALYDGPENSLSCDTSSCDDGSSAALVGALALLRLRRRRSPSSSTSVSAKGAERHAKGLTPFFLILAALSSTSAVAQSGREDPERERPWIGFGRGSVTMAVGSYKPNIDANSSFPVYECFFDGATLPQLTAGGDLHLWDGFGSIQASLHIDLMQANGFAQPLAARESGRCERPTATAVQMTMAALRPGLTYRFDPFLDWFSFPLVPYGRVGLVGVGYMFSKGGDVNVDGGHNPIGARYGTEGALGLMLALDFLDPIDPFTPEATRRARANGVFDHAFLFVEGAVMDISSFGEPGFDLSPKDDFLDSGLPATFRVGVTVEFL